MKSFKELRQDPHRPSEMNPADYVFVGVADDHPGDSYLEIDHKTLARHGVETGVSDPQSIVNVPFYEETQGGRPNYRCHHCGKHGSNIRYFVFFLHKPTKQVVVVGRICAKKLALATKAQLDIEGRAAGFRQAKARLRWREEHREAYDYLLEYSQQDDYKNEFLDSLWEGLGQFGSLTDRQLAAVVKWVSRGKPWVRQPEQRGQGQSGWENDPATSKQLSTINRLMDERQMPSEARQEARRQFDAGLTKGKASRWIDKLLTLPKIGEGS